TNSAPLASSASSMTCWFGKRALPAISREVKVVPAMISGSAINQSYNKNSTALKRAHDFNTVSCGKRRRRPLGAADDAAIDRYREKARGRIDTLLGQKPGHGCGGELRGFAADRGLYHHASPPTTASRGRACSAGAKRSGENGRAISGSCSINI